MWSLCSLPQAWPRLVAKPTPAPLPAVEGVGGSVLERAASWSRRMLWSCGALTRAACAI
ncbi:hypothetical protein DUNSADRAFT_14364 [Dunaliella salina]|uniref:Uncharacterized protein n=1 Tax=Dunaliella salina TaxID=3046 RepID=A0ABZ3KN09_DUNSA|nr:hypothetical protein DUNSADRAFT_14364 [Dunaliella salina]|eukprot:KAF5830557.1 hypothetical protein DUNSADRAFT_14364 [Dunaliella salina]